MGNKEKQEKLLLESILEKGLKRYDLRLLEGPTRYLQAPAHEYGNITYDSEGIRQVKTSEKNLYLKMHPYAASNVNYELIRIDNEKYKRKGYLRSFFSGKKIEVARFRAGQDGWARLRVSHFNGKPSNLVGLTTSFDFKDYLINRLKKAGIYYEVKDHFLHNLTLSFFLRDCLIEGLKKASIPYREEGDRISFLLEGDNFTIKREDLGFVVRSCLKFLTKKYKSYLNYARKLINAQSLQ